MKISLKRKPFMYDSQLKRMLVQLMSCFAGYQVMTGIQRDGKRRFLDVPIIYGDHSQAVAYILNGGSDNAVASLPIMSLYMVGLNQKAEWRQNPHHWEYYRYFEQKKNPSGDLLNLPGRNMTIERHMPIPYDLRFDLAIWASNNDQGYQLVEQICSTYAPDMDIQLSNSPADWTFLTTLFYEGGVTFEKGVANVGQGGNPDPYYLYTLSFSTVVYLSLPVKVYESKMIREIHVPIKELEDEIDFDSMTDITELVIKVKPEDEVFES